MAAGSKGNQQRINQVIHPPVDNAETVLAADHVYIELPFFPRHEDKPTPAA